MSQSIQGVSAVNVQDMRQSETKNFASAGQQASGNYKGDVVIAQSSGTSIMDAAEEMTFAASETKESEEKELSERTLKKSDGNYRLAEVEEVLQNMQDFNQEDMARLLKILQAKGNFSLGMLNDTLRNTFKDNTHQHGALLLLQEAFADNDAALNVIGEAIDNLEATHGAQIRAGYNIAPLEGHEYATDINMLQSDVSEKRLMYRDTILHFDSYTKTLLSLADKYGETELPQALNFLGSALSLDMRAAYTSIDLTQLKEIADGITMMQNLTALHQGICRLMAQMEKMHGETNLSVRSIMEPLLTFKDLTVVSADALRAHMPFLESDNAVRDAALTQGVMALLQELPHKMFATTEVRLQLIEAFKEVMEEVTAREEALYD